MKRFLPIVLVTLCAIGPLHAQATKGLINPLLRQQHLQTPSVVTNELYDFMMKNVPPLTLPSDAKQWAKEAAAIRAHELSVLYHGWPKEWIDSAPKFEKVGVIQGNGYRIVKLRYEIVPGFESVALLYEPEHMTGKMPAILNVTGHGGGGKAVEQKQKRCINQARRGILALNIEYIGFGELSSKEYEHNNLGLLELAGKNGAGLFYLTMRRGLDYLYNDPNVDRSRIGVTGLSGGGWQTIVLSSLDTRVGPAVAVAGYSTLTTSIEHPENHDLEQNSADFRQKADYAQLTAIRAPRPTLLIYNSMDDCCFRAGMIKQGVYSDIKPFFNLYGKPDNLQWYMNLIPGTHNYGILSREVSYKFFDSAFHLDVSAKEFDDTDAEVKSYADLTVGGLPKNNLTILGLARSFAQAIHHEVPAEHGAQWAESQRTLLREVVRYSPVTVTHAVPVDVTHERGVESAAYRFDFSNGLSATGILFRSVTAPENAPTTVLFSDEGIPSTLDDVVNQVDRGRRVLVFDPLFFGQSSPEDKDLDPRLWQFEQLLSSTGQRPLGLDAAQIAGVVRWLATDLDHGSPTVGSVALKPPATIPPVRIITTGPRSETIAIVAAALEPALFSQLDARKSIPSLQAVYDRPITYIEAPELMCLDLYKDFDFNTLSAIAAPVKIDLSSTKPERISW